VCPWGTRWYSRGTHVGPESRPSARPAASVRVRVFLFAPPSRTYRSLLTVWLFAGYSDGWVAPPRRGVAVGIGLRPLKWQAEPSPDQMCQDRAQFYCGRGRAGPSLRADVASVNSQLPAQLGTVEVWREYFCVA
jgi:hypothetical protein